MKNCKLIVTDLDGTLLRNDKSISKFTLETLKACRNQGILIGFATARPIRGVAQIREVFEPDILITHNGAVFTHGEHQVSMGISGKQVRIFLEKILSDFPYAEIGVESDDVFWANYDVTKNWLGETYMQLTSMLDGLDIKCADKILVCLKTVDPHTLRLYLPDDCYLEIADDVMGMIMRKQATKFNGIVSICNALGISPSEVVSFGDDNNDISMIQGCAVGVAVNNANLKVKNAADVVCESNENDGVAKWIQGAILGETKNIDI